MSEHDTVVDAGTRPASTHYWKTTEVRFHNFVLPTTEEREDDIISPQFTCCGYQWRLTISLTVLGPRSIGINLYNVSNKSVTIDWAISMRDIKKDKEIAYYRAVKDGYESDDERHFDALPLNRVDNWIGWAQTWHTGDFIRCSAAMANLTDDGTLILEVRMRPLQPEVVLPPPFIPKNPINNMILKKFMDEDSADVIFEVGGEHEKQEGDAQKKSKTSTSFYAHLFILQDVSTTLAELCKSNDENAVSRVQITDVKPDVFKHMLYYTYGGKLTDEELKENAKDLIDACNKYGMVHLKLEAEACYVQATEITVQNMMDNLLYADSMNCALLKESVIDYMIANGKDVLKKVPLQNVPGSVVADLLTAMTRKEEGKNKSKGEEDEEDLLSTMRVSDLRMKLDEKGLEVDGSREAMISALKEADESTKTAENN